MESLHPEEYTNNSIKVNMPDGTYLEVHAPGAPDVLSRPNMELVAEVGAPLEPIVQNENNNQESLSTLAANQTESAVTAFAETPTTLEADDLQVDPITVTASIAIGGFGRFGRSRKDRLGKIKELDKKAGEVDYDAESRKNVAARLLGQEESLDGGTQVRNGKEKRQAIRAARRKHKAQRQHAEIQLMDYAISSGKPAEKIDGTKGKPNSVGRESRSMREVEDLVNLGGTGLETNRDAAIMHATSKAESRARSEGRTPTYVDVLAEIVTNAKSKPEVVVRARQQAKEKARAERIIKDTISNRRDLLILAETEAVNEARSKGKTATIDDIEDKIIEVVERRTPGNARYVESDQPTDTEIATEVITIAEDRAFERAFREKRDHISQIDIIAEIVATRDSIDSLPENIIIRAVKRAEEKEITRARDEGRAIRPVTETEVIEEIFVDSSITGTFELSYVPKLTDRDGAYQKRLDRKKDATSRKATESRNRHRQKLHDQHEGQDKAGRRMQRRVERLDDKGLEAVDEAWKIPDLTPEEEGLLSELEESITRRINRRRNRRSNP